MEYRLNRRTGDSLSVIGIGSAYLGKAERDEGVRALRAAFEGGINFFDLAAGDGRAFPLWGEALGDVRDRVRYQIHFGADYTHGAYAWTLEKDAVLRSVDWQLSRLRTDTIDYGFIHCQDELSDWEAYRKNGVYACLLRLKEEGVVRHIGLSSHTPAVAGRILDEVPVDQLMFSLNPAYDRGRGEFANGSADERGALCRRCAREGIGISVMKPFSGGQLLSAAQSPLGRALTARQCLRYALDTPGVLTAMCGVRNAADVHALLHVFDGPEEEPAFTPGDSPESAQAAERCVYCNHCQPCPAGLDIGLINKCYDLARAGDGMAAEHYRQLSRTAKNCTGCGHCDKRCPFRVRQSARMAEIARYFGK